MATTTKRSSVPAVKSLDIRDINNAIAAIDQQLRVIKATADTANLKAGQAQLNASQGGGTLITLQQQVTALQAAVSALTAETVETVTLRADAAVTAYDPVYPSSDGGVSPVDTQDPTTIFAVIGVATAAAAAGGSLVVRRAGTMTITGASFESGRAVYAELGSGLTQRPNYASVALPMGVAVSSTVIEVRAGYPDLREMPLYEGGYEDFMPVTLGLVRQVLDFVGTVFGQEDGIVVKIGSQLVTRSIITPSGSGVDVVDGDGVLGDPAISLT